MRPHRSVKTSASRTGAERDGGAPRSGYRILGPEKRRDEFQDGGANAAANKRNAA